MPQSEKVDEQTVKATVGALRKELGAVFYTNKDKINEALLGKSKQEITAIRSEYKEHYGIDLDSELHKHLSGKSLSEAEAALSGDRAQSFVASLHNRGGLLAGQQHIQSVLEQINGIKDVAERNRIRTQLREQFSAQYAAAQKADPSDRAAKRLVALVDGDQLTTEALNLDEQLHAGWGGKGGFLGLGLGVNKASIIESVEKAKDPAERHALLTKYQEHTGQDLGTELAGRLKGTAADLAKAVISGDADGAAAARIHAATEGFWGTDKEKIFHQLEGSAASFEGKPLSPAQLKESQARVIAKYNQQYGQGNPKAFDTLVTKEMNGLAADRMHELLDKGQVSDELTLKYAMHEHFFADKEALKKVLAGKSKADIDKLGQEYAKAGYGDLKTEIGAATDQNGLLGGGRDGFEIQQLLKGTPKTPSERMQRAQETYEFERGSGSKIVGRGFMDLVSHSGRDLDLQHNRVLALQEKIKHNGGRPADGDMQELIKLTGYQSDDVKAYQESKDSTANSAAMGAALVVGTVATIASGGTAGPATAAVIGSLAGGAASLATKMTMQGSGYSTADLKADLVETGVSTLTAGLGQSAGVMRGLDKLLKIGPAGGGLLKEAAKSTILGTAGGLVSGAAGQLDNEQNYLGEGTFAEKFVHNVAGATVSGAGAGLAGGAAGRWLGHSSLGKEHQVITAGIAGAAGGVGSGLAQGLATGNFNLDWKGVAAGAVSGSASAHQAMKYQQAWHLSQALPPALASLTPMEGQPILQAVSSDRQPAGNLASRSAPGEAPPTWEEFQARQQAAPQGMPQKESVVHHGDNSSQHLSQIKQLGLAPQDSYQVNNAKIKVGELFEIGDARVGVFMEVEVNGQKHLRTVYRSNSQGSFRLLPASNEGVPGFPGYDKAIGEHALQIPSQIEEVLAKKLMSKKVVSMPEGDGEALMKGAAPVNRSMEDYAEYVQSEDYLSKHVKKQELLAPPTQEPALRRGGHDIRRPEDIKLASPKKEPDFSKLLGNYKTTTSTAGEVEAMVFKSKDGTIEYTVMRDKEGRAWFNKVTAADAAITSQGVHSLAIDAGDLVMPLWEYAQQVPAGFAGERNSTRGEYVSTEKYLNKNQYLNEFKSVHADRNRQSGISSYTLSQIDHARQESEKNPEEGEKDKR